MKKSNALADALINVAIFFAAAWGTYLAQSYDRPRTGALIFLIGVILIAVRSGLFGALLAAIAASLTYNFFLSEPVYEFGLTSADEAVPLIAFNISALMAGILIGRLKDSVNRAYRAQTETAFLLTISDRLQSAIKVEDVEAAIRSTLPSQGVASVELYLCHGKTYLRPSTGEVQLEPFAETQDQAGSTAPLTIVDLKGARGHLGLVKFRLAVDLEDRARLPNLKSVAALLALATERCLLLEEVAEARGAARGEALKDAILSSVSHDLRTPLTVIEAAAGALRSENVDLAEHDRRQLLSSIVDQCRKLDRYTTELLDVGRIQSGISPERMESLDLREVVQLAIKHVKAIRPAMDVRRHFASEPVQVRANAAMLEQALFNVIDNAQKFAGESGPVEISTIAEADRATVIVADHGSGIDETRRALVFGRFVKIDGAREAAGIGLGLFIAKGFVEAFSGSMAIDAALDDGTGTRVSIHLPRVAGADDDRRKHDP